MDKNKLYEYATILYVSLGDFNLQIPIYFSDYQKNPLIVFHYINLTHYIR